MSGAIAPMSVGSAVISSCGRFRYELRRRAASHNHTRVCWIMLNPSTADAEEDDPTIRRCVGFTGTWGYGGLIVVNLWPLRTKDPRDLRVYYHHSSINGSALENRVYVERAIGEADMVVAAWGARGGDRGERMRERLDELGVGAYVLGVTRSGQPRHPLYVAADTEPVRWDEVGT